MACSTKNAKGNKCQTGHNSTAITLAGAAKFGEAFEVGTARLGLSSRVVAMALFGRQSLIDECPLLGVKLKWHEQPCD